MPAQFIGDGSEVPATPLKSPQPEREWHFGRYEITRFPRPGRWAAKASPMSGAAGYRTPLGALLGARRAARTERAVTNVTVTVAGSVTSERDLARAVAAVLRSGPPWRDR